MAWLQNFFVWGQFRFIATIFWCTLPLRILWVLAAWQIKDHNSLTYWILVYGSGGGYNKQSSHRWCQTWEGCSHSSNGDSCGLMRAKVVHTFYDCSVLLAGKLWSGHSGNSCRKWECKVVLFLTVIVHYELKVSWCIYALWTLKSFNNESSSSACTGDPRSFLPCYKPLGYGWTMTSPRKARLLST